MAINSIVTIFCIASPQIIFAVDTRNEEKMCAEIGFKPKSETHADCVLELLERKKGIVKRDIKSATPQVTNKATSGDGTQEHVSCINFGFEANTPLYSDCRMKMEIAKRDAAQKQKDFELAQRQYESEVRQYQEQLARYEKEKERQKGEAMMKFGLALMGGSSPYFSENLANAGRASLGLPPTAPTAPRIQNFTITTPGGRVTTCSVIGNNYNCF